MKLNVMFRRLWPVIGIIISACLFVVAATYYPGGTTDSTTSVGYEWEHNFISSLFAPTALNGAANPARVVAIPAMLVLCVSIGALFQRIANNGVSGFHRKAIAVGGIGAMVYAFLVVTPMHNLMVDISLPFALVALCATLHLLHVTRHSFLFYVGSVSVALLLVSAVMYYGHVLFDLLPVMQKASLVACVGWLVAVQNTTFDQKSVTPNTTIEPMR